LTQTVSNAVEQRKASPADLIRKYSADFATVLPSQVNPATWVRLAEGALRKGKRLDDGRFELEAAAANNPGAFLAALLEAARQGLEPGTEQYYLTARKVKGRSEILGITGYQGYIELMYRAGSATAVIAEVVRVRDEFRFDRNSGLPPQHHFPPFARNSERGDLIGVYAYARLTTGEISKVVDLNRDDIALIRKSSASAAYDSSPWNNHEVAMWLKSAVRQLQKWVPTSAEFRKELARAAGEARRVATAPDAPAGADAQQDDFIDGDFVSVDEPDDTDWPPVPTPGGEQ
jgi:recombination protein RecT